MAKNNPEQAQVAPGSKVKGLLEVVLWIWCLAGLCYFYYTQGFLTLLKQLWNQALG